VRRRSWWWIALGAVLAVVVTAWVSADQQAFPGRLDPRNPKPGGAQAVARVLEDQGVDVHIARGNQEFLATTVDGDTLVVVTSSGALGRSTAAALLEHASAGHIVVVDAGPHAIDVLGYGNTPSPLRPDDDVSADCSQFSGLTVDVDEAIAYRPTTGSCFDTFAGALVVPVGPRLTYLGAGGILENRQILHGDNAAVALRMLGSADHLVWYVPDTDDLAAGDEVSLSSLLPTWLRPALWLLGIAVGAVILWRARRLGRLAVEPLPVTVKAIETTQSRGRLYRKANDRGHAAQALRHAALTRVADRLRLPHDAGAADVIDALAHATERQRAELHHLLYGGPPAHDRDLIQLATTLAELDDQLRKAPS